MFFQDKEAYSFEPEKKYEKTFHVTKYCKKTFIITKKKNYKSA